MATAVSIAIRRDAAQARIQQASIELAAKYGVEGGDLSPFHKDADQRMVRTLEAIADFLERMVAQPIAPVHVPPALKPAPTPRKA
jgi:hypothetical protein